MSSDEYLRERRIARHSACTAPRRVRTSRAPAEWYVQRVRPCGAVHSGTRTRMGTRAVARTRMGTRAACLALLAHARVRRVCAGVCARAIGCAELQHRALLQPGVPFCNMACCKGGRVLLRHVVHRCDEVVHGHRLFATHLHDARVATQPCRNTEEVALLCVRTDRRTLPIFTMSSDCPSSTDACAQTQHSHTKTDQRLAPIGARYDANANATGASAEATQGAAAAAAWHGAF